MHRYDGFRAAVVGGSIGGLFSALLLRELGFTVDVFERTPEQLDHRGGGIVLQPITMKWFHERSGRRIEELSTRSSVLRYLGPDDAVEYEEPAAWRYTSWGTVYRALLGDFGREHYHLGEFCAGLTQDADRVELRFVTGRVERADLVVFADGISSTGRRRLSPIGSGGTPATSGGGAPSARTGWRARTHEPARRRAVYTVDARHPRDDLPDPRDGRVSWNRGRRLFDFVWYRNVAAGPELDELTTDVRGHECPVSVPPGRGPRALRRGDAEAAATQLAPAVAEVIPGRRGRTCRSSSTRRIPGMAQGRAAVIGDAAFAARPHAAAGTAKAAADAWTLFEHLGAAGGDIPAALKRWEPGPAGAGQPAGRPRRRDGPPLPVRRHVGSR